jgi:hypothetical protein
VVDRIVVTRDQREKKVKKEKSHSTGANVTGGKVSFDVCWHRSVI